MIVAVIMAGGRGERLKSDIEKPLLLLNNKPLIDYVIDNLKSSHLIEDVIIATSPNTPNTKKYLIDTLGLVNYEDLINVETIQSNFAYGKSEIGEEISSHFAGEKSQIQPRFSYFETSGNGYVEDLSYILSFFEKRSKDDILLFINADLPLITSDMIDDVLDFYLNQDKPALSTVVPVEIFKSYNIDYEYEFEGNVPSGLNILRSENVVQDEVILHVSKVEFAFNINTIETAEEFNKFLEDQN